MVQPKGIFVRNSRIYVSDPWTNSVFVFASTAKGHTIPLVTIEATSISMGMDGGEYVDSNNNMYLAGQSGIDHRIYVFNGVNALSSGLHNLVPDRKISCEALDNFPVGIWVDETRNILYGGATNTGIISIFNNASTLDGVCSYSSSAETGGSSAALAVDTNKNILYVATGGGVQIWDNSTTAEGTAARTITLPGWANRSYGIALDPTRP